MSALAVNYFSACLLSSPPVTCAAGRVYSSDPGGPRATRTLILSGEFCDSMVLFFLFFFFLVSFRFVLKPKPKPKPKSRSIATPTVALGRFEHPAALL